MSEDVLRRVMVSDLVALIEAARAALHDLTVPQQDQFLDTVPKLRRALKPFKQKANTPAG